MESITTTPPIIASGEKAKARDILAAIRTLQRIEQEQRPATPDERQASPASAASGRWPCRIFPDPVTGRYKDAAWQALGEELQSLLTPEEYASAKRTDLQRLLHLAHRHRRHARGPGPPRRPAGCHRAGARLRHRQFHGHGAREGMRFIGVELDGISGRIARALHPGHDIRIEIFSRHETARGPHRRRHRQRALRRRQARLPRPEAVAARFLLRQVSRRTEARRHPRPGHQPFHARQAERRRPRVPGRARPIS